MDPVKGENVVIQILDGTTWKLYACGRSCTLEVQTEVIEITGPGDGKWTKILPTKNSFSGTIDGVCNLNNPGMLTLVDLRKRQVQHTKFRMKYSRVSVGGNSYTDEGDFYITGSSDQGTFNDVNTFSIEVKGTGALVGKTKTPSTTEVIVY